MQFTPLSSLHERRPRAHSWLSLDQLDEATQKLTGTLTGPSPAQPFPAHPDMSKQDQMEEAHQDRLRQSNLDFHSGGKTGDPFLSAWALSWVFQYHLRCAFSTHTHIIYIH